MDHSLPPYYYGFSDCFFFKRQELTHFGQTTSFFLLVNDVMIEIKLRKKSYFKIKFTYLGIGLITYFSPNSWKSLVCILPH